ncbi:MAG: serine--tRNA ligase, partial [Deltaproteobacteria bacterium]|nr:serine--tRNA ligase [Deltaproteobacteria bacterium]
MLDSKYFGEKLDVLIAALEKRNVDTALVNEIKTRSDKRKKAIGEVEQLKALRNQASAEIAAAKKAGQNVDA